MTTGVVQLQTTLPDETTARSIAAALVDERLAACVQVLGPVGSTFRWQGRLEQATEWLCLIKTTAAALGSVIPRLEALHPYELPEIIVTPVVAGSDQYLGWITAEVRRIEPGH